MKQTFIFTISILITLSGFSIADVGHSESNNKDMGSMMNDAHDDGKDSHAHSSWPEAPEAMHDIMGGMVWNDQGAADAGKALYEANCASCHGISGEGDGPISENLTHTPADLTQHFHKADGSNDAYLFWRISKGGTVEPFKSQNSAMPAFESMLNEKQRWQVLAYVHQQMHQGFLGEDDPLVEDGHMEGMVDNH